MFAEERKRPRDPLDSICCFDPTVCTPPPPMSLCLEEHGAVMRIADYTWSLKRGARPWPDEKRPARAEQTGAHAMLAVVATSGGSVK